MAFIFNDDMTARIDFHSNVRNQLEYACRLIRKALAAQCKLVVRHQNNEQLAQFDQLLWQFSTTDFLPHVDISQGLHPLAEHTPVLLTLASDNALPELESQIQHNEILINLSNNVPENFSQFKRLIEIVPQEEQAKQAGRERYRFYQQQGCELTHINVK